MTKQLPYKDKIGNKTATFGSAFTELGWLYFQGDKLGQKLRETMTEEEIEGWING